jgi:hypothetical protein
MPSRPQVGSEVRQGRFSLGLVVGLIAPPVFWCLGLLLTGPFPFVLTIGLLGVGLALKVADEHRRTGDGILCGFAVVMLVVAGYVLWWLNSGAVA